jgi:hypothetical protein
MLQPESCSCSQSAAAQSARAGPAAGRRDGTIDAATTDASGAYTDTYTYTTPGTYTINATFQGSPTTLAAGSPGAGGITGDYLLPCGPRATASPRPAAAAGTLAGLARPTGSRLAEPASFGFMILADVVSALMSACLSSAPGWNSGHRV